MPLAESGADEAAPLARQIGGILAEIASVSFPQAGFLGPDLAIAYPFDNVVDAYFAHMEACLFGGRAGERLGPDRTSRLWRLVEENRSLLDEARDARHLVHADFGPANSSGVSRRSRGASPPSSPGASPRPGARCRASGAA